MKKLINVIIDVRIAQQIIRIGFILFFTWIVQRLYNAILLSKPRYLYIIHEDKLN